MHIYPYIIAGLCAVMGLSGCSAGSKPENNAVSEIVSSETLKAVSEPQNTSTDADFAETDELPVLDTAAALAMAIPALTHSAAAHLTQQKVVMEPDAAHILYLMRAARYREAADYAQRAPEQVNTQFLAAKSRILAGLCSEQNPCSSDFSNLQAPDAILDDIFEFWRIRALEADLHIDAAVRNIGDFHEQFHLAARTRSLILELDKNVEKSGNHWSAYDAESLRSLKKLIAAVLDGANTFEAASLIHIQMMLDSALGNAELASQKKTRLILEYPATQMALWPELADSAYVAEHFSHQSRYSRVERLISHFDYDDARIEIHSLLDDKKTPANIRNSVEWELARISLSNAADPETSEKIYRKWAKIKGSKREEAVFGIARALSRQQKFRESIRALEDYDRQFPKGTHRMRSLYLRGWYYFELRENENARPLLREYAEKTNDTAVWGFYAQTFIRDERWDEAISAFENLKNNSNPIVRGKALYWQAYAEHQLAHDDNARARLNEIHREFPLTWYDILAFQRAEDWFGENADEAYKRAFRYDDDPRKDNVFYAWGYGTPISAFPGSATWKNIELYASYDALEEARKLYRNHETALLAQVPASQRDEFRRYATHLVEFYNGAWEDVSGSVKALSGTYPSRSNPRHKMGYPQPFAPLVQDLASEYGLPPYFIYGIMLQESRFRPWQVSSADAIGALQMIPKTARPIAKALGLEYHPDTFFNPRVGFPYSAYYMKMHYEKWGHNLAFTAGSYNGGPHRIGPWALRDQGKTIDFVVDEFSYDESRHYARKVVEHTLRFAYLYAGSTDEWLDVVHKLVPRHVPEIQPTDDWGL